MKKKLWILVLLQCLFLLGVAGQYYAVQVFGKEILLKAVPVDPRDPFRGDFARLGFEISRIPAPQEKSDCKRDCKIFVLLEKKGQYYVFKEASFADKFEPEANEAVLVGKAVYHWESERELRVTYGFEQVFVEEGMGKPLEDREAEVTVAVKVWNGRPVLNHVYLNGQLYK
ncbi:GDYXXLXY domain-containing protein [Effusibacillus lacus]|uniref:GDYXXLXY domain-containing protein n=1 Tax=Effusibacillus lacus TaxID=1348429 RepID=A0A292YT19_9BACL|nr:GDYXXLXY domain-containing protein [Effusibacillus lacus]TCS76371.1 putative membrane-anchored protein [Effusibacillus lacus]GAX91913.1 hypothetical protein EFBL_3604 [Effusibacillus lacus]